MHCFRPKEIVNPHYSSKTEKGRRNLDLYRGISGDPLGYPNDYKILVPCGKCLGCFRDKARSWRVRLLHEHMFGNHFSCLCVTLTLSDDYYAQFQVKENVKRFFRAFIDRLRYYIVGRRSPKRFFISELGEQSSRLHFHGFIWDTSLSKEQLSRAWPYGFVDVKPLASARQLSYVTKYITKAKSCHIPYIFVSPGLGSAYCENESWLSWHHAGNSDTNINLCVRFDSYVYALPAYYRKKIFSDAEISDFKVCLSKSNKPFEASLARTTYSEPLAFAQARERLLEVSIRSQKSLPLKKVRPSDSLDAYNPYLSDDEFKEFTDDLTPF